MNVDFKKWGGGLSMLAIIGLVVIAAVLLIWAALQIPSVSEFITNKVADTTTTESKLPAGEENQLVSPPATSPTPTTTKPTTKKLSYAEAIKKYQYRFQFVRCSGTPGSLNVKQGSTIMLDNRDGVKHAIAVGTQAFSIPPYDYALATADDPAGYYITCDGGGAARLYVYP